MPNLGGLLRERRPSWMKIWPLSGKLLVFWKLVAGDRRSQPEVRMKINIALLNNCSLLSIQNVDIKLNLPPLHIILTMERLVWVAVLYTLGFQNVADCRIYGVAALIGFSHKQMYGRIFGGNQRSACNNKVTVLITWPYAGDPLFFWSRKVKYDVI